MKLKTISKSYEEVMAMPRKKHRKPIRPNMFFRTLMRVASIPDLIATDFTCNKIGMEKLGKKEPCLYLMNHCSFIDPIVIHCLFWKRRIYSLATKDLYDTKLKAWLFHHMHCIQVDKQNFSLDSFHEVTLQLKRGKIVSIFPEGQMNYAPENMLAFKSGIVLMAHKAKVPILPVYLVPPENWHQRRVAVIGEPIDIRSLCGMIPTMDELNRAADYIHEKEEELKQFYLNSQKVSKEKTEEQEEVVSK